MTNSHLNDLKFKNDVWKQLKILRLMFLFFSATERKKKKCLNIKHTILNCFYIGLVVRLFANGPEDRGSIPGRVILKPLKMVLDTSLLNTQQYKVHIKGQVEQSRERSSSY